MNTVKIYAIYDSKAEHFQHPFFQQNNAVAMRSWQQTLANPESEHSKFPADFTLFCIGEYNDAKVILVNYDANINLGTALELMAMNKMSPQNKMTLQTQTVGQQQ